MQAKSTSITGTMQVGEGRPDSLFLITAIAPYGDKNKIDITLLADHRHVSLQMDRESAIKMANRILNELGAE